MSCHGDGGRGLAQNSPMVGVTAKYPKMHHDKHTTIEDRINGCFQRSMNGEKLVPSGLNISPPDLKPKYVLRRPQLEYTRFPGDRKSTRLNSSHVAISYAVFCLKKKIN